MKDIMFREVDEETLVATTPGINYKDVAIRHEPELSGGFAQLAKKGTIKFTSYEEK
jgi:hypothetical protein